jgi:copper transport protein
LTVAFAAALVVALVATPVYTLLATSKFAERSFWALGTLVPLLHTSAFGRGYLDLELLLALFGVAAAVALWVDRPDRPRRSVAELLATCGAMLAAAAVLFASGVSGHASQTAPRWLALVFDWTHLVSGSLWIGGLIGLLVLWWSLPAADRLRGLALTVPRFSTVAFCSVMVLLGSGIGASVLHLPTLASLWQTSYGKAIIVKASILLAAMLVASGNLLRTAPALRLVEPPRSAAVLLRRLVSIEVLLVASAIAVAAVLSSLPPPPKALASIGSASAHVGPGPVIETLSEHGYELQFHVAPNKAAVPNEFALRITKNGKPVRDADVTTSFTMLDMEMQQQSWKLDESSPGIYERGALPALVMVGHWGLSFEVTPPGGTPFTVLLVDRAGG